MLSFQFPYIRLLFGTYITASLKSYQCSVMYIVVCAFALLQLAIVLSALQFVDSDCPSGIFTFYTSVNTDSFIDLLNGHR
jgi:hypothetical protein